MITQLKLPPHLIFDWGNTLMADQSGQSGPMYTWPEVKAMPGAGDVIPRLAATHTLSIATNADQSGADEVRKALARVGLEGHFKHIFTAAEFGLRKEDDQFWPRVLGALGAKAEDVCMIGDSLETDVLPAMRAGLATVWYLRSNDESVTMPHFLSIRTLRELLTQFE